MADNTAENKVLVTIFGDEYPIAAGTDPAYISKIAKYVDKKMNETAKSARNISREKVAILAAMTIASELYEEKDTVKSYSGQFDSKVDKIMARIDSVLA